MTDDEKMAVQLRGIIFAFTLMNGLLRLVTIPLGWAADFLALVLWLCGYEPTKNDLTCCPECMRMSLQQYSARRGRKEWRCLYAADCGYVWCEEDEA